ncbi:carbohydrate porin [Vibrio sp. WXL103]|uniref:carbohydrate porin n=1 Tax=unclassified Vibrio TaxID=2614977 RepID=UPI003EC6A4FD
MKRGIFTLSLIALAVGTFSQSTYAGLKYGRYEGLSVSGYGKASFGVTNDRLMHRKAETNANGLNYVQTAGNPYTETGSLGNEGGEVHLYVDYGLSKNDQNWVAHIDLASGATQYRKDNDAVRGDNIFLDQWWVHGVGVIPSNPDASVWMGKRKYPKYSPISGNDITQSDGIGVGIDNFDVDFAKWNVGIVAPNWGGNYHSWCGERGGEDVGWACQGEKGWGGTYYSLVSSLKAIEVTDWLKADVFGAYRTYYGSDKNMTDVEGATPTAKDKLPDGFQIGFQLTRGAWTEFDRLAVRYNNKTASGVTQTWLHNPSHQIGGYFTGLKHFGGAQQYRLEYTLSHETAIFDDEDFRKYGNDYIYDETYWNQAVIAGTYIWNQRTSTKIELAYDQMKFVVAENFDFAANQDASVHKDGTNSSYKVTLAQDLHIGGSRYDRPLIRFFVTYGKLDTKTLAYTNLGDWRQDNNQDFVSKLGTRDALSAGVMFQTWWN